jgi:hypothetical protein
MLLAAMLISRAFRVETLTLEGGAGVLGARTEEELDCGCPTLSRSLRRVGARARILLNCPADFKREEP